MAVNVDQLITVYKLDDQYSSASGRMLKSANLLGLAIAGVTAALSLGAFAAVSAAADFERMTKTMEALTGSAEEAAKKMKFLQDFAETSVFEFKDLVEAGTLLTAFGLNLERLLPTITSVAAAFGPTAANLEMLTNALGRLSAGQFGEAMEILRRFGITARDLSKQGIEITKGGQIVSSAEATLTAVEKIAKQRFGKIGELMGETFAVRLSNFQDAWHKAMISMGSALLPHLKRVVELAGQLVNFLDRIGAFEGLGKALAGFANAMTPSSNFLARLAVTLVALFRSIPERFEALVLAVKTFANAAIGAINSIGRAIVNTIAIVADLIPGVEPDYFRPIPTFDTGGKGFSDAAAMMQMANLNTFRERDRLLAEWAQFTSRQGVAPGGGDMGFFRPGFGSSDPMAETARNTREVADNTAKMLDPKRYALGGGDMAGIGATRAEMRGASRAGRVRVEGGHQLGKAVEEIVNGALVQLIRSGFVTVGR